MSDPIQPEGSNNFGVVLTVGIVVNNDRCAIVMPLYTDSTDISPVEMCKDAVDSFVDDPLNDLLDCMSQDACVSYVAAEGMMDGKIPCRRDFASDANPGTLAADTLPSESASLAIFYEEPTDVQPGDPIGVGKNFIPGIPQAEFDGSVISSTLQTNVGDWAEKMMNGYSSSNSEGKQWYRCLKAPIPREATPITRVGAIVVRGYVGAQRRRQLPH